MLSIWRDPFGVTHERGNAREQDAVAYCEFWFKPGFVMKLTRSKQKAVTCLWCAGNRTK